MEDSTACSNCTCPINYDCKRFNLFFEGRYILLEQFEHNNDYSCDHKPEDEVQTVKSGGEGLF